MLKDICEAIFAIGFPISVVLLTFKIIDSLF